MDKIKEVCMYNYIYMYADSHIYMKWRTSIHMIYIYIYISYYISIYIYICHAIHPYPFWLKLRATVLPYHRSWRDHLASP